MGLRSAVLWLPWFTFFTFTAAQSLVSIAQEGIPSELAPAVCLLVSWSAAVESGPFCTRSFSFSLRVHPV
jgi:hypothetical protein